MKPAGKKIERLSLLSGGERSLAAVALLIAIFKARPSPFYIMDEVEAALDDANLGRLLTIFEDLRESSQLIVITHQKRTMEIADALYGVSMRQDGVSAVVGQRVAEDARGAERPACRAAWSTVAVARESAHGARRALAGGDGASSRAASSRTSVAVARPADRRLRLAQPVAAPARAGGCAEQAPGRGGRRAHPVAASAATADAHRRPAPSVVGHRLRRVPRAAAPPSA